MCGKVSFSPVLIKSFTHERTTISQVKDTFRSIEIQRMKRIIWKATIVELRYLIQQLINKGIIKDPPEGRWIVTMNCFIKEDNTSFSRKQLHTARGLTESRRKRIDNIISKLIEIKHSHRECSSNCVKTGKIIFLNWHGYEKEKNIKRLQF